LKNSNFFEHRKKFLELLPEEGTALFLAAQEKPSYSRFKQDKNLYYVTGISEPESALFLSKRKNGEFREILFVRPRDKEREIWDGKRLGLENASDLTGVEQVHEFDDLQDVLEKELQMSAFEELHIDFALGENCLLKNIIFQLAKRQKIRKIINLEQLMGQLRLFKSAQEIDLMRLASQISIKAHRLAKQKAQPGIYEYQVQACLESCFREYGADIAYPSIVASGNNAVILHYNQNNSQLKEGDLLLIDAGCEYREYAADITRTFAISGDMTTAQQNIYDLVLSSQEAALNKLKNDKPKFEEVHMSSVETLVQGLLDLKLIQGSFEEILHKKTYKKYFMHRIGHSLGLDVHDIGVYSTVEPNMVVTIEPGLYFDASDESIPIEYRGIGIRIEDDVLKTDVGIDILTSDLEK